LGVGLAGRVTVVVAVMVVVISLSWAMVGCRGQRTEGVGDIIWRME
jgi:hypothetical protein